MQVFDIVYFLLVLLLLVMFLIQGRTVEIALSTMILCREAQIFLNNYKASLLDDE